MPNKTDFVLWFFLLILITGIGFIGMKRSEERNKYLENSGENYGRSCK